MSQSQPHATTLPLPSPGRNAGAMLQQVLRDWGGKSDLWVFIYDPKWLHCDTARKPLQALTFTLSRRSPNFTGNLSPQQYQEIFARSSGRYGTTLDYARKTLHCLQEHGIHDPALVRLLAHASDPPST